MTVEDRNISTKSIDTKSTDTKEITFKLSLELDIYDYNYNDLITYITITDVPSDVQEEQYILLGKQTQVNFRDSLNKQDWITLFSKDNEDEPLLFNMKLIICIKILKVEVVKK